MNIFWNRFIPYHANSLTQWLKRIYEKEKFDKGWYAIEVMIDEKTVSDIVPKLKKAGT
ncbi:MAG: hypothetical protein AB1478_10175 [Nitrospirota bacterium]